MTAVKLPPDISPRVRAQVAKLDALDQWRLLVQIARVRDARAGWFAGRRLEARLEEIDEARRAVLHGTFAALARNRQ